MWIGVDVVSTFHEFINGYMKRKQQPPVGFIAGGTGNSVLTSLGLTDTAKAAEMVIHGFVRRIDLGHVATLPDDGKSKYWVNLIGWGVGVDANVVAESCRCCGPARYNFGGMVTVFQNKTRNATVDVDGCKINGPFDVMFVCVPPPPPLPPLLLLHCLTPHRIAD